MSPHRDIDDLLRDWPYMPGVVAARLVKTAGGRSVLQMRVELGLLQMETTGRPDGQTPGGAETYLDYLLQQRDRFPDTFQLSDEQYVEIDREFLQYYQRRLCWLALRKFHKAVDDAEHTLALMDFVAQYSANSPWAASHERYRPLVLFHRVQAAALAALEDSGAEVAVAEIEQGLDRLRESFRSLGEQAGFSPKEMFAQLEELREWLRHKYDIGPTLDEQLADAVAAERYELAARLRDEIAARDRAEQS